MEFSEVAAGRPKEAERLLLALESFANESGLIPEQIYDSPDIPDRELFLGRPSGSAMPLVWAHAEQIKLSRSLQDVRVFDLPQTSVERYLKKKVCSPIVIWRFNHKCRTIPTGKNLRIELLAEAIIHWSSNELKEVIETKTRDTGIGIHLADIPTSSLKTGEQIHFTFFWSEANRWEEQNFSIKIISPPAILTL